MQISRDIKTAHIILLHKKRDKEKVEIYCPVSNLCSPSKAFEKNMLQDLQDKETLNSVDQHKNHREQLYSASGRALRHLDWKEESYKRAIPDQWEAYEVCLWFYGMYHQMVPEEEWIRSKLNQLHNSGSNVFNFVSNSRTKCGFNIHSNCLKLLNGKIGKDWIDLTKTLYKARCKETFINAPLIHW
jgi:hypothetical protein